MPKLLGEVGEQAQKKAMTFISDLDKLEIVPQAAQLAVKGGGGLCAPGDALCTVSEDTCKQVRQGA